MKRRIIAPVKLAAENAAITQFLFDATEPADKKTKLPLQKVFEAYDSWRRANKMPKSDLTIDGFGRLFPRTYARRASYWPAAGHGLKCVFGLGLKA